jgi:hypothetical protein
MNDYLESGDKNQPSLPYHIPNSLEQVYNGGFYPGHNSIRNSPEREVIGRSSKIDAKPFNERMVQEWV